MRKFDTYKTILRRFKVDIEASQAVSGPRLTRQQENTTKVLLAKRCRALNPNMQELLHLSEETILCSLMKQLPECERKILENIEKIISILIY